MFWFFVGCLCLVFICILRRANKQPTKKYQLLQIVVVGRGNQKLPIIHTNPDPYTVRDLLFGMFMSADVPSYVEYINIDEISQKELNKMIGTRTDSA